MTFISYEEAQTDGRTGLIGYAEMLEKDQQEEDEELDWSGATNQLDR